MSGRPRALWRRPELWLLEQAVGVALWMTAWRPLAPVTHPDTLTYRSAALAALAVDVWRRAPAAEAPA